ncbi:energy transducer TonB [Aureimonas sp. Leaf324]|jgi:protein TonB|uniref:energy transducer TonB family protein n=1 Tax=Aureimonas sp. Leaf324 TaxID=1736336 RepID=UPI0006F355DB|nr:energy transducer TonB [Aureimonas sp. Leaf324]KQQ81168.1 hypothetical protein ASF65_09145 [Aureimonas sp. Leaf324]
MTLARPDDLERGSTTMSVARWGTAMLCIATAHAAAAWFFVQLPPIATPPTGAPEAPILIELAPPEAAPPAAPAVEAPEPAEEPQETPPEPLPPEPEPEPPPPEPIAPPPEPDLPPPVEEPPPVVDPEPLPEPPAEPQPEPPPAVETPAEAVINAPVPRARPRPPEPRREVAERRPERPREAERPRERERPRTERRQAAAPASSASRAAPEASQGQRVRSSVSPARWQSQVSARLNRFKRTPRGGGAGTVRVSFTITASGAATGIRLSGSSGNPALDEAALSLVRRASPFPAPPEGGSVPMTVPIAYTR